jgi:Lipocalin-like domain
MMILIMIIIIMMNTSVKLFERPNKSAPFFPAREELRATEIDRARFGASTGKIEPWGGRYANGVSFLRSNAALRPAASADDKDKLIGAWKIVSAVVEDVQTHEQKPLYGEHPKGYLILLATGRMMSLLVSEGRKAPQTDEERSVAYRSMVAYTGKYAVDGDKWTTTPDVAWNEAWPTNQVRTFKLEGNRLTVETAPALNPNFGKVVHVILVWQREE